MARLSESQPWESSVDILAFFKELSSDWLGWMSSFASVVFTACIVLRPGLNKKRAYFVLTAVCFTIASVHVWTKEHRARLLAEEGKEPGLVVRIEGVMVGELPSGQTALTVVAKAINLGAPSIYSFEALSAILPDGTKMTGQRFLPPPRPFLKLSGDEGTPDLYLQRSDYLNDKGIGSPISRGGALGGWIIVILPGLHRESMPRGTKILLEGRDAYGKRVSAEASLYGVDPWSKLFNPKTAEKWSPQ